MSSFRIKPKFKHVTDLSYDEISEMIKKGLEREDSECEYQFISGALRVKIPEKDRHYWSPELNLSFEEIDDKTEIVGRYGPNSGVWTLIIAIYAALTLLTFFIGIYGSAKMSVGLDGTILWLIPVFFVIALAIYITAQFGQKLGAEQMFQLHFFYQKIIGEKIKIQ